MGVDLNEEMNSGAQQNEQEEDENENSES